LHDSREEGLELLRRRFRYGLKDRDPVGQAIDVIEHQAMEMNIEIGCGAKALDEGYRNKRGSDSFNSEVAPLFRWRDCAKRV